MNHQNIRNSFLLLLAAVIWGVSFVAQSVGMEYIGPFAFNGIRCLIGGLVLIPVILLLNRNKASGQKEAEPSGHPVNRRNCLLAGGIICGICLFLASTFQQFGIQYTTVGKAGFITAFYIILVPIFGLFLKKKCTPLIWISVLLALGGLYLLCIKDGFSIGLGDIYVFICAILFSVHILVIDYFSPRVDGVKLACIQFFICGVLSVICMLIFESSTTLTAVLSAWKPLLYAGALSCGVAYTLQIIGQRNMNPTVASLLLSMESCISVIAGWLILGQALTLQEIGGCVLMFIAIVLAQVPAKNPFTSGNKNYIM